MESVVLLSLVKLLAVAALVLANGFFVAAEFSLVSVRRTRVEELIAQGNLTAVAVRRAIEDPDRFIAATQLGITIASLGLGWIGEPALAHLIEPLLRVLPAYLIAPTAHAIAAGGIAFALITFLHVVLGELAPKSIALQYPEETALTVARPTLLTENIFRPFIWLLNGTGNALLRLFGLSTPKGHERVHSVEELKMLVTASHEGGVLKAEVEEMIHKVFEFGQRQVHEAMIPRPEIVGVPQEAMISDFLAIFKSSRHARFPVYGEDLDDILGFVGVKDVLLALAEGPSAPRRPIKELARPALFVPESKRIGSLFGEMRQQQVQLAVIIDEYGGTAGMVTLEELVEEIVGRLSDELVAEPPPVKTIDERTVEVDAQLRVDELNEELDLALPEGEDYETVAGFLLYQMRRIPEKGEQCWYRDLRFTVTQMKGPKIEKVQITRLPASPPARSSRPAGK